MDTLRRLIWELLAAAFCYMTELTVLIDKLFEQPL